MKLTSNTSLVLSVVLTAVASVYGEGTCPSGGCRSGGESHVRAKVLSAWEKIVEEKRCRNVETSFLFNKRSEDKFGIE